MAENVMDFSRNFKRHYNTKDKKMNEAVKLTQQILLGNFSNEQSSIGAGVETRSMKKVSAQKVSEKKETKEPIQPQKLAKDPTCKKLFQEETEVPSLAEQSQMKEVSLVSIETKSLKGIRVAKGDRIRDEKTFFSYVGLCDS